MGSSRLFTTLFVAFCLFISVNGDCNVIKPKKLRAGDNMVYISPGSPYSYKIAPSSYIPKITGDMNRLGLIPSFAPHMSEIDGQWAGPDANRAADVNTMFKNQSIKFMLSNRGGSGCSRILHRIDYDAIRNNPKIIMGYSDLTALTNAIHSKTGLVTFHGPMGTDTWNGNNNEILARAVLFSSSVYTYRNPSDFGPTRKINGGRARGKLIGGNLSLFNGIVNTEFLHVDDWSKVILFLEATGNYPYTLDNRFAKLKLSGILDKIAGFVWGTCDGCPDISQSHTIQETVDSYIRPLNIPSFSNSFIGHHGQQFPLPIGIQVEIDADAGTIKTLEPALV